MNLKFKLAKDQVFGNAPIVLVGASNYFSYQQGVRGEREGTRYDVLMLNSRGDKLGVKIKDTAPIISQEELDKRNQRLNFILVDFINFSGYVYEGKLYAKADGICILEGGDDDEEITL